MYKHTFVNNSEESPAKSDTKQIIKMDVPPPPFKIGLIGCGQLGTVLLTKLLEVQDRFHNMQIIVSTRQPHLLKSFKEEFGVKCIFDNQKVAAECDIVFMTILPTQSMEVFKEIRAVVDERNAKAEKDPSLSKPLIVSACAAMNYQKLRLLVSPNTVLLRTNVDIMVIKEYLFESNVL